MDFRDDLQFLAWTVAQESQGEPELGQLGVAWVVMNRALERGQSVSDVVLDRSQFSCWNTDSPTRKSLDTVPDLVSRQAYKASVAAYFNLSPDPTKGAQFYLNPEVVKKVAGKLPSWYDPAKVTLIVGNHHFLRL